MSKWHKKNAKTASVDETKRKLVVQMADEEYGEALGTVAAMIEQGIEDPDAFYDASYAYFMSGDYERATQWVDNTLRLAPQHLGARILLARICFLQERTLTDACALQKVFIGKIIARLFTFVQAEHEDTAAFLLNDIRKDILDCRYCG